MNEDDEKIIEMLRGRRVIVLLNKTDLPGVISQEAIQACIDAPVIRISAKEEKGIEELENTLKDLFFQGELAFNDEICITNIRHKQALQDAYESLLQVKESIALQMPEDFFSIDLMGAYESLGKVIGESVEEDLVNEIFSKFCMGK